MQTPESSLEGRAKALEDSFFAKRNKELLEQVSEELHASRHREQLKAATAIQDDAVLDKVLELGVTAESLTALAIAPLVLVAWSDGKIPRREREAILAGAEKSGCKPNSAGHALLQGWLAERPDDSLFDVWSSYIQAVREKLLPGEVINLQQAVLGRCQQVAEAAGGFLGLGSISTQELEMLRKLKAAFESR